MGVWWAMFNPLARQEVILATDVGVWSTNSIQELYPRWNPSNSGLANVQVKMFRYRPSDNTVIAATYGRGLYSAQFQRNGQGLTIADCPDLTSCCNDSNACTIDLLAPPAGCVYVNIPCIDSDVCTDDVC